MPTIPVQGGRLYYDERGSGTPLLLIHGTGGASATWNSVARQLASSHRVITYDRRGFGRSADLATPKGEYLKTHTEDAATLLRELGAIPAIVVGASWGGIAALSTALSHPGLVRRLVVFEPPFHSKKRFDLRTARTMAGVLARSKLGLDRRAAARFLRFALLRRDGTSAFDELDEASRSAVLGAAPTILAEIAAGTGEEIATRDLRTLRCPVTLVAGGRSAEFLTKSIDALERALPDARVVRVASGDHMLPLRDPAALVRAIAPPPA